MGSYVGIDVGLSVYGKMDEGTMKTIQMTIDDRLLTDVDQAVLTLGTNRSAFIRDALKLALHQFKIHQLELQHAAGYAKYPQDSAEIAEWETEQVWSET